MFRNPRENRALPVNDTILPSVGRPPTPPAETNAANIVASSYFTAPTMSTRSSIAPTSSPVTARQPIQRTMSTKKNGKQNQSILNFFGKAEKTEADVAIAGDVGLFFNDVGNPGQKSLSNTQLHGFTSYSSPVRKPAREDSVGSRYNEDETPVKRRRVDNDDGEDFCIRTPSPERRPVESGRSTAEQLTEIEFQQKPMSTKKRRGGFVDDSSDEDDDGGDNAMTDEIESPSQEQKQPVEHLLNHDTSIKFLDGVVEAHTTTTIPLRPPGEEQPAHDIHQRTSIGETEIIPTISREGTSLFAPGDFGDEDLEDEEFFDGGEEYMERRWMEEQREMEMGLDEDSKSESGGESILTPKAEIEIDELEDSSIAVSTCPICNGSMKDLSEAQASSHVNACLDGKAAPLPNPVKVEKISPSESTIHPTTTNTAPKRFQRAAIARPAQSNPFSLSKEKPGSSAFSKLMSGHAEDAAWAEAAANEMQSRGKPAYQRTCPFYKIMPGLYICVDAFRYGKVEGQNAYFLSHFHSDHYIGLTSSWAHGPIYASKVTCNLMRQQLRVDPKWIVPLEFEKKVEVPNTNGVFVTMIPANHCPGSSLYLFEKVMGKNKDGSPKLNRILHCGDFRACPAHVNHPLLRPDVLDAVTGQTKQQVIDTCYLDTTYLTPKYAFPSQHDVIDACAKMCVSLAKEIVDTDDNWEKIKLEKAGSAMTKFLEQGENKVVKDEEEEEDKKPKLRGRLLVVIGTYSIGKERICLGIAKALGSKIFAPPGKMRICRALEDAELNALLTADPLEAQIHMQTLMEIRAETLHDYLVTYRGHFTRVVGFRPTGWSYRPPTSRFTENPAVQTILHSDGWKSRFTMRDLVPQRGSTKSSNCFGVPYSEHSSFRELTMFCCALRINRVVPTVNVGSARSREKMKSWIEKWDTEKRKNGLYKVEVGAEGWGSGDGALRYGV